MSLHQKFEEHKSPFDDKAWEQFDMLRKNKRKHRVFWWWFFGVGVLLLAGLVYWYGDTYVDNVTVQTFDEHVVSQQTTDYAILSEMDVRVSPIIQDSNKVLSKDFQPRGNIPSSKNKDVDDSNNGGGVDSNKEATKGDPTSPNFIAPSEKPGRYTSAKIITTQKGQAFLDSSKKNYVLGVTDDHMNYNYQDGDSTYLLTNMDQNMNKWLFVSDMPLLTINHLDIKLAYPEIDVEEDTSIIEIEKSKRQRLTFSGGPSRAYINGFSLDNPVKKEGVGLQLAYSYDINKLIAVGFSGGYWHTIDTQNPDYEIKDKEGSRYIHAVLTLYPYNEGRHTAYFSIGAGPTVTDRVLGTFLVVNMNISRTFQIGRLSNIGITGEVGYQYAVTDKYGLGAFYRVISHNDGGWTVGVSSSLRF